VDYFSPGVIPPTTLPAVPPAISIPGIFLIPEYEQSVIATFTRLVHDMPPQIFIAVLTLTNMGVMLYAPITVSISINDPTVTVLDGEVFSFPEGIFLPGMVVQQSVAFNSPNETGFVPTIMLVTGAGTINWIGQIP
jgi:hypothetical protein